MWKVTRRRPFSFTVAVALTLACAAPRTDAAAQRDEVVGTWRGVAEFRGVSVPMSVRFARERGFLRGWVSSPELAALELPVSDVAHDSGRVYFTVPDNQGALAFAVRHTGDTLRGTATLPDAIARREGAPTMTWRGVRGLADPPPPYLTRELRIAAQGATLAATLVIPRSRARRMPAVLILQGSSTNLRDEYRYYADHFARAGFVVLSFDKRGAGASTGDYRRASYDDLVFDARAAYDTLAAQREVDARRVGIWGLSQGAFLAPRVADHVVQAPAFVVAVSSPGLPIAETAAYQDSLRAAWAGFADDAPRVVSAHRALAAALRTGASSDRLAALFRATADAPWRDRTSIPRTAPPRDELRGWYWYGRILDPVSWWGRLHVPVLLVYGEADELVPARTSAERLARALHDGGNADATVRVYPGANHVLKLVHTPLAPAGRSWDWPRLVPGYMEETTAWMIARVGDPLARAPVLQRP